jgi:hypothetical protein
MVGKFMVNNVEWLTASFLWDKALEDDDTVRLKQPAILRFDTDTFMQDLVDRLEKNPNGLKDFVARYETWTDMNSGWLSKDELNSSNMLKLYQTSHGFFYLIASNLVCMPSMMMEFSDKKVDAAHEETVSFILRCLVPAKENISVNPKDPTTYQECAWVVNEQGAGWQHVSFTSVLDQEERLPLFSLNFTENGRKRRLLTGLIPAANRERYQAEPKFSISTVSDEDPREDQLETRIVNPIKNLQDNINLKDDKENFIIDMEQVQEVFAYILSDMADFLNKYAREVWDASVSGNCSGLKNNNKKNLCKELNTNLLQSRMKWIEILQKDIPDITDDIENSTRDDINSLEPDDLKILIVSALDPQVDPRLEKYKTYIADKLVDLLDKITHKPESIISDEQAGQIFIFIIIDFVQYLIEHHRDVWTAIKEDNKDNSEDLFNALKNTVFYGAYHWDDALREVWDKRSNIISGEPKGLITANLTKENIGFSINSLLGIKNADYRESDFYSLIKEAIENSTQTEKKVSETPVDSTAGAIYWLRCIYERPRCNKAPLPIISEPSQPFQMASFFDPDAPRRPVQISMPPYTSIPDLKKYQKNISLVISNKLKEQMERAQGKKLSDLDEGNLNEYQPSDLGTICSFSIPIVTFCALMLLMAMVQSLNIIFWWLPFFKICLPKKAK